MSKIVYLNEDGIVQEIIPEYALPVEKWYGAEFASRCVEAPDDVKQGWVYNKESGVVSVLLPDLESLKNDKIAKSKSDLSIYLENHPLQWTDGNYYNITAEKQNQLTSKIMAATMASQASIPYTLTWNSTGEVCKGWTLQDLSALAFAIDARVTALVTYQQTQEVAMRNAKTLEELNAIVVNYDSVG